MRRIAFAPAAALVLLGFAACSSDSKSSTTTTAEAVDNPSDTVTGDTATGDTITDDTVTDDTITDDTVTDDTLDPALQGAGVGTEFCDINTELSESEGPGETPEEVEAYFTEVFPDQLSRLADATPPEMQDDVAVLIDGITGYVEVLEDNAWNVDDAFADPAMEDALGTEEFSLAGEHVDAYCLEG